MKTLLHRSILFMALTALSFSAFAQDDDGPPLPEARKKEIKTQKVAFLTQRIDLTPEEAQKFWPIYNQYDHEIEAARKELRELRKDAKGDDGTLTEAEASKLIDDAMAGLQKELDIRKRYAGEFKRTIGAVKTAKLLRAEKDFNRELVRRMRGSREGGGEPPPHRRP